MTLYKDYPQFFENSIFVGPSAVRKKRVEELRRLYGVLPSHTLMHISYKVFTRANISSRRRGRGN
jgi:hypothetical protein